MIHLAEMTRHNTLDLYHLEIAGGSMKTMFDAPFDMIKPSFEFPRIKDSGVGNILEKPMMIGMQFLKPRKEFTC